MSAPVKPLPRRPDVLERIRPMQMGDAERVAALHQAAMGRSLWARLGTRFLTTLYRSLMESQRFLGFVYLQDGRIDGFIAGSTDVAAMYQEIFHRRWLPLGVAAANGLLRRPSVLPLLLRTGSYFESSGDDVAAESLFCSFVPALRGTGVSNQINKVLFDDLLARGIQRVKISTEVDNKGANRQLRSWGFQEQRRFTYYHKPMISYVLDLQRCPRVEPVSRHPAI